MRQSVGELEGTFGNLAGFRDPWRRARWVPPRVRKAAAPVFP